MAKKMSNSRIGVTLWLLTAVLVAMSGVGVLSAYAADDNDTSRWIWKPYAEIGAYVGANAVLVEGAGNGSQVMVVGTDVEELEGVTKSILVDPVDPDNWYQGQLLSGNRISPSLTVLPAGKYHGLVLAAGGYSLKLILVGGDALKLFNSVDSCELIDPQGTGTAAPTGHMKTARGMHTAIQLDDQGILVAGGLTLKMVYGMFPLPTALNSSELYTDGNWTPSKHPMSMKRFSAPAVVLTKGPYAGKVLVVGGFVPPKDPSSLTFPATATCEIYDPDPKRQTWTALSKESLKVARGAHTLTLLKDGRVLAAGGQSAFTFKNDPSEQKKIKTYRSWEIYDPEKKTWTIYGDPDKGEQINRLNRLMFPAAGHTATLLDDNKTLLVGGGRPYATQLYDPVKNVWRLTADALWYPRSYVPFLGGHTATLADGKVLVCEGGPAKCELFQPPSALLKSGGSLPVQKPLAAD